MLRGFGTAVLFVLGAVLLPICSMAALLLPRRDGQGWRPQPPAR